jgi:hypothetical protein
LQLPLPVKIEPAREPVEPEGLDWVLPPELHLVRLRSRTALLLQRFQSKMFSSNVSLTAASIVRKRFEGALKGRFQIDR